MRIADVIFWTFIGLAGSLCIAILVREFLCWLTERHTHRSLKFFRQIEDEHYQGLHRSLLEHVDALLREVDRP